MELGGSLVSEVKAIYTLADLREKVQLVKFIETLFFVFNNDHPCCAHLNKFGDGLFRRLSGQVHKYMSYKDDYHLYIRLVLATL